MNQSEQNEKALLTDQFTYFESTTSVLVNLFDEKIVFYDLKTSKLDVPQQPTHVLSIKDIAGSMIGKSGKKLDTKAFLTIYAYPKLKQKKDQSDSSRRKRITVDLAMNKFETYNENLINVNQWHKRLEAIIKKRDTNSINNEKPYLIFVNPTSGSGKAKNIYYERIVPIWAEANIPDTLFLTGKPFIK